MNVDFGSVVAMSQMAGDDDEDTELLMGQFEEAKRYILGFEWCQSLKETWFGFGVGGLVAVFLFRIEAKEGVDDWLWVVTGDTPSCYLVTDFAPNPRKALEVYCELMEGWIAAVREGRALDGVFPVAAAATLPNADLLKARTTFLREQVLLLGS